MKKNKNIYLQMFLFGITFLIIGLSFAISLEVSDKLTNFRFISCSIISIIGCLLLTRASIVLFKVEGKNV